MGVYCVRAGAEKSLGFYLSFVDVTLPLESEIITQASLVWILAGVYIELGQYFSICLLSVFTPRDCFGIFNWPRRKIRTHRSAGLVSIASTECEIESVWRQKNYTSYCLLGGEKQYGLSVLEKNIWN